MRQSCSVKLSQRTLIDQVYSSPPVLCVSVEKAEKLFFPQSSLGIGGEKKACGY